LTIPNINSLYLYVMRHIVKRIIKEVSEEKPKSNLNRLLDKFKMNFPEQYRNKVDVIEKFVIDYITDHNFTVKFLNYCNTGFAGVRTKDQIIICAPHTMNTLGDFIYTVFHEIRHEEQMGKSRLGLDNPFSNYDLNDFENLAKHYWDLELDADRFGKEMIARLVIKLGIPLEIAKEQLKLSQYIENYPSSSKMVIIALRKIVNELKELKKDNDEPIDIQDHPMVKMYLDKLENLI